MFDGPPPQDFARPAPPRGLWLDVLVLSFAVMLLIGFVRSPAIVASPPLRQIEFVPGPSKISVYVRDAGYRLLHKPKLIAVMAGNEAVTAN